ncbi:alpha/beta fold hydrolase [Actinokineospora sp. NPDC004072]
MRAEAGAQVLAGPARFVGDVGDPDRPRGLGDPLPRTRDLRWQRAGTAASQQHPVDRVEPLRTTRRPRDQFARVPAQQVGKRDRGVLIGKPNRATAPAGVRATVIEQERPARRDHPGRHDQALPPRHPASSWPGSGKLPPQRPPAAAQLRSITLPVLAIYAGSSTVHNAAKAARRTQDLMPHAEVELWPRARHSLHVDLPDRLARRLLAFARPEITGEGSAR